jgi:hypothetical protein
MSTGAIAISSELILYGDSTIRSKILYWLEQNMKDQKMFVDQVRDLSYFIGESELFKEVVSIDTCPVYHLIIKDENIELYETGSTITL